MVDKKTLKLLCESCVWNNKCPVKKKAMYCDDYNNYKERLIVKEGKRMNNYILSIKGNQIQIIKPDRTSYEIVYQKVINKPKKDLLVAYKMYMKLNYGGK